jgi:HipA-like C-terminal domain
MASSAPERVHKRELLSPYRAGLPTRFDRVAKRGVNWELPRNFKGYRASSEHEMSIGGAATKCYLSVAGKLEGAYIAKFAHKNDEIETYTELFNNQLGKLLGFEMAHSGIAKLDGVLHFLSRSFRREGEQLVHGSLMVEMLGLADPAEIEQIRTVAQQQGIFDIDFVETVMRAFCGADFDAVFDKFVAMLVFDALIGSMDRHPRNWGVIRPMKDPGAGAGHFRFSPIYDSARALLWDMNDAKVEALSASNEELKRYIDRSSPRIGLPHAVRKCNHFDLLSYLASKHKALLSNNLRKLPSSTVGLASDLLHRWPFSNFCGGRKRGIIKVIQSRFDRLVSIA